MSNGVFSALLAIVDVLGGGVIRYGVVRVELLKAETRRLKKLQDVLGDFQDACVAGQLLRRYAEGLPMRSSNRGQFVAPGQLIGTQDCRAARRRADFTHTWEPFESTGGRTGILTRLAENGTGVTAKRN